MKALNLLLILVIKKIDSQTTRFVRVVFVYISFD